MTVSLRAALLLFLVGPAFGSPAGAQQLFTYEERPADLSRYANPAQCVAAVARVSTVLGWGEVTDTMTYTQRVASRGPVRKTARDCGVKFLPAGATAASLPESDLDALFTLAIAMDEVPLSGAILQRRLKLKRTAADSGEVWFDALIAYAMARPIPVAAVRAAALGYDRTGSTGDVVSGWWTSPHEWALLAAIGTFDTVAIREEAHALLANVRALPPAERNEGIHEAGRSGTMALIIEDLPRLLSRNLDSAAASFKRDFAAIFDPNLLIQPPEFSVYNTLGHLGEKFTRLPGDFWFNLPAGDSLLPRKGRVTLVWPVTQYCSTCSFDFATMRRLKQRFGTGLDVVLVSQTSGFMGDRSPMPPAEEAEVLRSFFLDFYQGVGPLGVTNTPFTRRPDPDRRRVNGPTPEFARFKYPLPVLLNSEGRMVLQVPIPLNGAADSMAESLLGWMIQTLLSNPAAPR